MGTSAAVAPTTPVIVGVGQVTNRPQSEGEGDLSDRPEPLRLMVDAVASAIEDCDGVAWGGHAPSGRSLLARTQSLRVVLPLSWPYTNPGAAVAEALGIEPPEQLLTTVGGESVQRLVNDTALAVGRGELEVAVLVGADCAYTRAAARRHPDRPLVPWTVQDGDTPDPLRFGSDRRATTEAEELRGLDLPVTVYPLFENALRAKAGRHPERHRHLLGTLWSKFADVAAANHHAWHRDGCSVDEVMTASEDNRMVAYPYTKLLSANIQVDQGAAIIVCSAAAAEAAGVARDRWVFPLAGADADDHWFLSHRADFHSSPAIHLAGRAALGITSRSIDDVAHLDLYSCFPSAVQIAADELGADLDDASRPVTVTGGLTFAGGPGNNYGSHAIASMVGRLRENPGSVGLVTGVGWYLTKHSVGLYGTEPGAPDREHAGGLPDGTSVAVAGGFAHADPQAAVASMPQCTPDTDATGAVTIETYSVLYTRDGQPTRAVVACRTPEGYRAWGSVADPGELAVLVSEEGCGRPASLSESGQVALT